MKLGPFGDASKVFILNYQSQPRVNIKITALQNHYHTALLQCFHIFHNFNYRIITMLVTDVGDQICW